jgi:hypothetical protein
MFTVIQTPSFLRSMASVWSEGEMAEFIDFVSDNPSAGDVIPGTQSLRKVRWSRSGMGKRGGVRVIYFQRLNSGEVVLLIGYAKAKFDKLPIDFLNRLKETYDV